MVMKSNRCQKRDRKRAFKKSQLSILTGIDAHGCVVPTALRPGRLSYVR